MVDNSSLDSFTFRRCGLSIVVQNSNCSPFGLSLVQLYRWLPLTWVHVKTNHESHLNFIQNQIIDKSEGAPSFLVSKPTIVIDVTFASTGAYDQRSELSSLFYLVVTDSL